MPILVGTASWTDKSLIGCGRFYPKEASSAEARLRYYATQFPMVEVDSSYYAMPSASNAQLWAERTPTPMAELHPAAWAISDSKFAKFFAHLPHFDILCFYTAHI